MRFPAQASSRQAVSPRESYVSSLSSSVPVTAPVGGWNARDAWADMQPNEAIRLINMFPHPTYCQSRGGCADFATGMAANGKTLMNWNGPTTNKFFCATSNGIFDVSAAGAVGGAVASSTNGKFQWVDFAVASGLERLIAVNGVDSMYQYDGTTWNVITGVSAPIAITGVTTSNLIHVNVFKQRLYFIEKNKLSFWYLPTQSLGGAATEFLMNTLFPRGGFLMAMGTWTVDAGAGMDDYAVFITSEGEVAVFQGSDPGNANAWSLVGVYFLGKPIGRRCFVKYGGDLLLLLQDGAYPLGKALQAASIDRSSAFTNRIELAFLMAVQSYGGNFGWEMIEYKAQGAVIVNIPQAEDSTHVQYVMNTITQRWCQFQGWNAETFGIFNGDLYFATGTKVVKAWTGTADFGANIVVDVKTSFNYFGSDALKQAVLVRPIFLVTGPIQFLVGVDKDFEDNPPVGVATYSVSGAALWDVALWDVGTWTGDFIVQKDWKNAPTMPGFCFCLDLKIGLSAVGLQWTSTDWFIQPTVGAI